MKEQGSFVYGDSTIVYDLVRRDIAKSKAKNPRKVVIKVHADKRVVATAPLDADTEVVQQAVTKRARWIWQNLQDFARQKEDVLPRNYVSGETQFYLGRRYQLKVVETDALPSVKLVRGQLLVSLKEARADKVKALVDRWYQEKARIVFQERLLEVLPRAKWVAESSAQVGGCPEFRLLAMQKQWGSCSAQGNLVLNPHLVKAPKECIDYVILHELCHIAEHNHSERFWRLLGQVMPNWQEVKVHLDGMAELYLNE